MKTKFLFPYISIVLALFGAVFLTAEYLILPRLVKAPSREAFLMGHCAPPGKLIDDATINSMGYTGDVLSLEKPPGAIRILTLGGSAMFNRNMTLKIKEKLQEKSSRKIQILGAALRYHNTWSSIHKFKMLSRYNFDYVLIYHGINDVDANHVERSLFSPDYSHLNPFFKRNKILDNSIVARVIYNRFIYRRPPCTPMGSGFEAEITFKRNIETLVNMVRSSGGTPVLMTFAWSIPRNYEKEAFLKGKAGYNNKEDYDRCPVEMWGEPDYVRACLNRHNSIILKTARLMDAPALDQNALMGKDLVWFGDPVHLSEKGTLKFAENIAAYFAEKNWL